MREAGHRIRLEPALQGTHLKVWRLANLVHTDVMRRAMPWSRLILQRGAVPESLNVGAEERRKAALALLLAASVVLAFLRLLPFWLPLLLAVLAIAASAPLFGLFRRARGTSFALAAIAFHQLYYLYSTAAFVACWVEHKLAGWRGRHTVR